MTIDQWIAEERERVERFYLDYKTHAALDDCYPLDMEPGQWDQQYAFWTESEDKRTTEEP